MDFANIRTIRACAYTDNHKIYIHTGDHMFTMDQELLALEGTHNLYNSLASGIVAKLLDIDDAKLRESLSDFKGVPHRLEKVATVRGVQYINDSKATNVNSCWYALQSMRTKVVLILGGTDKGNDYSEIEGLVKEKARALIFWEWTIRNLHAFFDGKVPVIEEAKSMEEAVSKAYRLAQKATLCCFRLAAQVLICSKTTKIAATSSRSMCADCEAGYKGR